MRERRSGGAIGVLPPSPSPQPLHTSLPPLSHFPAAGISTSAVESKNCPSLRYTCHHCGYVSAKKYNLKRHIVNNHVKKKHVPSRRVVKARNNCCLCDHSTVGRRDIQKHYERKHHILFNKVTLLFRNKNDFLVWKDEVEVSVGSKFVRYTVKRFKTCTKVYHRCYRDGLYIPRGCGLRKYKAGGSNKINGCCPASLVSTHRRDGKVDVVFLPIHIGHETELDRLPLKTSERDLIAQKLTEQISPEVILREVNESIAGSDTSARLLNKKDIHNIRRDYNLNSDRGTTMDDLTKVESWAYRMKQMGNLVRFHKSPGEIGTNYASLVLEDFVLIVASDEQLSTLNTFGPQFICIDKTHKALRRDLHLTTILTMDCRDQLVPCSFLMSSRIDQGILSVFFSIMKELIRRKIATDILMTDLSDDCLQAWSAVMTEPTNWLYAPWHVEEAWKQNIGKIRATHLQFRVFKSLSALLYEGDDIVFIRKFHATMRELEGDTANSAFLEYFKANFATNVECWTSCYRKHFGLNVVLDPTHDNIRDIYLVGKKKKRLDASLHELLAFTAIKLLGEKECLRKKNCYCVINEVAAKHRQSQEITNPFISQKGDDWLLCSKTGGEFYLISNNKTGNCGCITKCEDCNICVHTFNCTCPDYKCKNNICVHIHFIAAFIKNLPSAPHKNAALHNNPNIPAAPSNNVTAASSSSVTEDDGDQPSRKMACFLDIRDVLIGQSETTVSDATPKESKETEADNCIYLTEYHATPEEPEISSGIPPLIKQKCEVKEEIAEFVDAQPQVLYKLKESLKEKCHEIIDFIEDEEEADILLKLLGPVRPTIEAKRTTSKYLQSTNL